MTNVIHFSVRVLLIKRCYFVAAKAVHSSNTLSSCAAVGNEQFFGRSKRAKVDADDVSEYVPDG